MESAGCNRIKLIRKLHGRLISSRHHNIGNALTLVLPPLSKGLYLVEIICDEGVVVKKVVVN